MNLVQKYYKNGVEHLHSDGGDEYKNVLVNYYSETTPDTPQHNPFAERTNRTLIEPVRTAVEESGLDAKYWECAIEHAAYVKNRIIHSSLNWTQYEKRTGRKPTVKYIKVFGCSAFIYN